jgi:hypothetical protein
VIYTSTVGTIGMRTDGVPTDEETPVALDDMIGHYKRSNSWQNKSRANFPRRAAGNHRQPDNPRGQRGYQTDATGKVILDFLRGRLPAYVDTGLNIVAVEDVAAGYYDPEKKEFFLLADLPKGVGSILAAHELTHALEDQYYDLDARLENLTGATVEDMRSIHGDSLSIPAQVFTKLITEAKPTDELSVKAQSMLANWNGVMERDAVAPTIYGAFRVKLLHKIIGSLMGPLVDVMFQATGRGAPRHLAELASQIVHQAKTGDASLLPPGATWPSVAAQALDEAVAYLRQILGDNIGAWKWGALGATICPLFTRERWWLKGRASPRCEPLALAPKSARSARRCKSLNQTEVIWAIFSSRVRRSSKSLARVAAGCAGLR